MTTMNDLLSGIVPDAIIENGPTGGGYGRFEYIKPVDPFDLFEYQRESYDHIFRDPAKRYAYVADDMGLGKSLIGWATAATLVRAMETGDRPKQPILFVVPPALRNNILREGAKFYPHLTTHLITTTKPKDGEGVPDADVIVIGNSSIRGKGKGRKFVPAGWTEALAGKVDSILVDEAHNHKNNGAARSQALAYLGNRCTGYKVLMSGTPMPNGRNVEMAMQLNFLGSEAWSDVGGSGVFYSFFAPPGEGGYGHTTANNAEFNARLRASFWIRHLRGDVLDLPNKGRSFVALAGEGKAKRDYLKAEQDLVALMREDNPQYNLSPMAEPLVRMNKMRHLAGIARAGNVAQHVEDILDSEPGKGVLIVAEHSEVIEEIAMRLLKHSPGIIDGKNKGKAREEALDAFTSGETRVLIGQVTSIKEGFTLHGDGKNTRVVFAQIPWSPAELMQSEDRLHRIGQVNDVEVEITGCLIPEAEGGRTIDERLWGALQGKAFNMNESQNGMGELLIEQVTEAVLDSYR